MTIFNDIIKSGVVNNDWDAYWEDIFKNDDTQMPKPVLVITNTINAENDTQLRRMLEACTLDVKKYSILQLKTDQKIAWHKLKTQYDPKILILLGIPTAQLGISVMLRFNALNNFDGCTFIPSASIAEMEANSEIKKRLWNDALKPVFIDGTHGGI